MTIEAKICGIKDAIALDTAIKEGARYVGFVFFPKSPRNITPDLASSLLIKVPETVEAVALAVDPDDELISIINAIPGISFIQLHGSETPHRVLEIKQQTGKRVIKAIKVSNTEDLAYADTYLDTTDMLLFDAKTPKEMVDPLPGGNAVSFDWGILTGQNWHVPWMLSGGLNPENVQDAIRISAAPAVDVSSGVECAPGVKEKSRITAFLRAVRSAG